MSRRFCLSVAVCFAVLSVSCKPSLQHFSVSGSVKGVEKGDTLRFERLLLPSYDREYAFDVISDENGRFDYNGVQPHDQYYIMSYFPVEGSLPEQGLAGLVMVISDGDEIRIEGERQNIYSSSIRGGIYDKPDLAEFIRLEDSINIIRAGYLQQSNEALAAGDSALAREYASKFNTDFGLKEYKERRKLLKEDYIENNSQGDNYLLYESILSMDDASPETIRRRYDNFSQEVKSSYYGKLYEEQMNLRESLLPGKEAPDFTLVTTDGKTVSKSDFAGKYLLIYHWGLCPGSMQVDASVQQLYSDYKESGLEVIGITESVEVVRNVWKELKGDSVIPGLGIDMKASLGGMLNHSWPETEFGNGIVENKDIIYRYLISGLPSFVFISPDGTLLAKGYHEAFYEAKKILEERFQPEGK